MARKKLHQRNRILQTLAGKNWGLRASSLHHLYRTYVRPGGLYASEVWGAFTAETHLSNLEACNNRAARIITGAPAGSPALATKSECDMTTIREEINDGAASLLLRCKSFDDSHHLWSLAEQRPRPRLKSSGSSFRTDWRTVALQRLREVPLNEDPKESINIRKYERRRQIYLNNVPDDNLHRRATEGRPLPSTADRSRVVVLCTMCV